ncbi:MAG: T9SS type A sorting domain-containing protein [Hymenobacter sp.]|nr:T9SS type A sorting domain-containing protein [Hymenobacter sp.]
MKYGPYPRTISTLALALLSITLAWAQNQTGPAYYSNTGRSSFSRSCGLGLACGNIANEARAVDSDFTTFATLRPATLPGLSPVALRMDMSGTVPRNHRAGVVIGAATGLSAIGTVTISTYLNGSPKQSLDATALALAALGAATPGRVEFLATEPFNQLEIRINSLLNVSYDVGVYYAYGIDANAVETARGVVSRFPATTEGINYSTAVVDNNVTVCANSGVLNPERAADQSLTNYATFGTLVGVSCPNTLRVKLESSAPAGYQAGFVVGEQSLLDLNALTTLRITTYKNGVAQETATGTQLLSITVLPGGQQQVSFPSTVGFDEVQLTRSSAGSALDNLSVFYGFGLEPSVFRDQTPVLSDFSSGAGQFEVFSNGLLCVLCVNVNVLNPERAADANMSSSDYAVMRTGLAGLLTSSALRLNLNGTGLAGNAAGVVLNQGAGLLNTQLLNGITLRTYGGPNGDQLLETASGASLLQQGLLPDGRTEVFFRTTQNFQRVEMEVDNAVAALDQTRIYYAFAQDRPTGFPTIINPLLAPLPVELRAFQAKADGEAVNVTWQTASEQRNSHFVVERAWQPKDGFGALGQVEGAGTSSSGRTYSFRDQTAASGAITLYYRLRQVDTDGTESFSSVAIVTLSKPVAGMLEAYPNPAATSAEVLIRVRHLEAGAAATLAVYDMRGMLLRRVAAVGPTLRLAGAGLPAGLYNLVLTGPQGQRLGTQRLAVTGR